MFFASSLRPAISSLALAAAVALGNLACPPSVFAAAPQVKTQAPGFYRAPLGSFEVTVVSDGTVDLPVDKLLHEPAEKTTSALKKAYLNVPTETSVNTFLINTGSKLILIDAGSGSLFGPTLGKVVENLRAAGYKPEQVDDIFITHMHPDHVGGLSSNGVTVFPNAVVHADKRDADFWLSQANADKAPADAKAFFEGAMASLKPYIAANRFQPFEGSGEVVPGVKALSSYGHTAGHTSYVVESQGHKLIVVGDLIHVGAVQLADPTVTIAFDSDSKAAAGSRASVFAIAAKEGALVGAEHLSFPGLGHLRASGKSWQWIPLNYSTQLN